MSRPTLAIVGTGIAGLGCAHFLQQRFDLTLFEANDYVGGHTNTVTVSEQGRDVPIDTGFMVFNHVTYPNLIRLFATLGVETMPTDMSFSVQHVPSGLEFCGSGWNHLFAQRRNLFRPAFWRLLQQINRFNQEAVQALNEPAWGELSLGDYVRRRAYGDAFLHRYLIPMSSAVWSTPPDRMLEFPATALLRFFHNHGFLGLHTQHPWQTVRNGAKSYVTKLIAPIADRIRLRSPIQRVNRLAAGVELTTSGGQRHQFDHAILACHADQTLRMLADADDREHALLSEFRYQRNIAVLHTDPACMPKSRLAWSSWNYRSDTAADGSARHQTIYWMNQLQKVSDRENYFVSINGEDAVAPSRVLRRIEYDHPLFTLGAIRAQQHLPELNRRDPGRRVSFCGSYFRYGFHEDAFASAVDLCRELSPGSVWEKPGSMVR